MNPRIILITAVVLSVCHISACPATAASKRDHGFLDIKMTPKREQENEARGELRTDANELAELLKIKPFVLALQKYKKDNKSESSQLPKSLQQARLICLWKIFIASEEVRKVVAMINYDISTSRVNLDSLTSKRDMARNMINTTNFLQAGVMGTVKQSLNLHGMHIPAQEVGITTFGIGSTLPLANLFMPSLWSRKIDTQPNMLSHVFNPSFRPDDADQSYLWKFMNSQIPGSKIKLTRREILVKHWEDFESRSIAQENRQKQLAAVPDSSKNMKENIRIVSQRMDLLQDMQTHIEEFDAALFELHQAISIN